MNENKPDRQIIIRGLEETIKEHKTRLHFQGELNQTYKTAMVLMSRRISELIAENNKLRKGLPPTILVHDDDDFPAFTEPEQPEN